MAAPRDVPPRRARPRARGRPFVPDGPRVRPAQRPAPGCRRPRRRRGAGDRHGRPDRRRGPADRHVLQGDAPAGQARRRPRPRAADPAPRRAVQRHGPAAAAAHDGPPPHDGRGRPDDPVLVAHPRGGRAARRVGAGRLCRAPGRSRRLPVDPATDDRPTAYLHGPLVGRPPAGGGTAWPIRRSSGPSWSPGHVAIRTADYDAFTRTLPQVARDAAVTLFEVRPTDDSLESVFAYLVRR